MIKQDTHTKKLHMTTILEGIFLTNFNVKTKVHICIEITMMVRKVLQGLKEKYVGQNDRKIGVVNLL